MRRKWTEKQLIEAVAQCNCVTHVLACLGLSPKGGNYKTIKKYVERLELDISHFESVKERMARLRKLSIAVIKHTDESALATLFKEGVSCYATTKRYAKKFLDSSKCSECQQLPIWNGKSLVLQLDHINGNRQDNRLENLRWLCPNCHTQTSNFSGRNTVSVMESGRHSILRRCRLKECEGSTPFVHTKKQKSYKIEWPSDEGLQSLVLTTPILQLAKTLGVSDVAIIKRCHLRGLKTRPRGYWGHNQNVK